MGPIALPDTCRGTTTLEALVDEVYDSMAYKWYFEDEVIPPTSAAIQVDEPGEYIVEISAILNGYVQITQQTFVIPETLKIEAVDIKDASCDRNNGSLHINANYEADIFYSINGLDFQKANAFQDLAPGRYTITIRNSFNCMDSKTVEVNSGSLPVIEKTTSFPATCGEKNGSIVYEVTGGTGRLSASINNNAPPVDNSFQNLAQGDYTITFTDEAGCEIAASVMVPGARCPIYIPNAFSPNDDGVNDLFQIGVKPGFGARINAYSIFDRWGTQIYEARNFQIDDPGKWWDGTFHNKKVDAGTYIYQIEVEIENGEIEILHGTVSIMH